jgi:AcrR family transcriptional regulator
MKTLKQAKYDMVLESIKTLMLDKGVNLSISEIAGVIEVGEATIYRYFGTKQNLIVQVGICLWTNILDELSKRSKKETGFESIEDFLSYFLEGYRSSRNVFVFLEQFDSLMAQVESSKDLLVGYDRVLYEIKTLFDNYFIQGVNDLSIKDTVDKDTYYYTTTHMILGICKRMAANTSILSSDDLIDDITQIEMALKMCLDYIRK